MELMMFLVVLVHYRTKDRNEHEHAVILKQS